MVVILALCLYRRDNYDLVIGRIISRLPRTIVEGQPSAPALSKARTRLGDQVMAQLFHNTAAQIPKPGPECFAFGLLVTAFDGTVLDLPASPENAEVFTTPRGGRFPQARIVTLAVCGLRWILAACVDSTSVSEQALVDRMTSAVKPGMLNLADRGFFSMDRWIRFSATGAHLLWRVKNGARSLPIHLVRVLPDGSALVRLRESKTMLSLRRARVADRHRPCLAETMARLVEFTIIVTDQAGRRRTSRIRVLTTLLDHQAHPAEQLAKIYGERWHIELVFARVKSGLRGPTTRLRGQSPRLARQEIWGLLTVYNALVRLAIAAAVTLKVDPDQISFAAVLALTRASITPDLPCPHCGHRRSDTTDPREALITSITIQPRNRIHRKRTSPRTHSQRRTKHTKEVSYEFKIEPPNLLK